MMTSQNRLPLTTNQVTEARIQAWLADLESEKKAGRPVERQRMLEAARRAEDGRNTVLLDPTK